MPLPAFPTSRAPRAARCLVLLATLLAPLALPAAPYARAWDFDDDAGLQYDPAKIEVADGVARLRPTVLDTGQALTLNLFASGQHAFIDNFTQSGLDPGTDSFVFAAWVRFRNLSVTHTIFEKRELVNGRTRGALLQFVRLESGYGFRLLIGTPDGERELTSNAAIRDGGWHHVAVTVDRSAGRAQAYIDGRPHEGFWNLAGFTGSLANSGGFILGMDRSLAQLRGDLDEVHFWRYAGGLPANAADIVTSHYGDVVIEAANLVSAWRFDDGTGADSAGPNHLTLAGGPGATASHIERVATDAPYVQSACEVGNGGDELYSADHALTAPPDQAEVRYQLSGDGTTWWYWAAPAGWTPAPTATAAHATLMHHVRERLPDAPFATGSLCFRAFFLSNGLASTGLDRFEAVGPPAALAVVAPPIAGRPAPGSFHVLFETDYPAEAYVEYREAGDGGDGDWEQTPAVAGGALVGVDVAGLEPGEAYEYRARYRPRGTEEPFAASEADTLPVAPASGTPAELEFAVWGDSRPPSATPLQPQAFYRLMEEIAGEGPVFHVAVGDNVNLSGAQPFGEETAIEFYRGWRDAYDVAGGSGYLFFALGNHDEGVFEPQRTTAANARLRATVQPTGAEAFERFYSWRWGDALFIAMDGSTSSPKPPQVNWILQQVSQPARWKFVFNHYPFFNSNRGISDVTVRNNLHANFLAYGVNVVFQAHDHWYADAEVNGIHYTTTGGGGSTLRPAEAAFGAISEYHYLRVRVEQYATTVRAIQVNEDGTPGPELDRYCVRANDAPFDNTDGDDEFDVCDEDDDGDAVADTLDNCRLLGNANQRDTNGDGFGNLCDADLDDNGVVNAADLARFRLAFGTNDPHADFDGNGAVNAGDLARFRLLFGLPPGPGAL